jgi:phosphatidylglycerol lysyltransferase
MKAPMERDHRTWLPGWLRRMAPAARAFLTFVALADVVLSLELWALHHPTGRLVMTAVLGVIDPVRPLAAVALASAALYLATRPKRAFRRILVVLAVGAGLLSSHAGHPALIAAALLVAAAALLAGSLWPEAGDPQCGRLGWSLLGGAAIAAGLSGWLLLGPHRGPHAGPAFALPLVLAFAAALAGLALLDRNPALRATWDAGAVLPLYRRLATSTVAPFALTRDKRHVWPADRQAVLAVGCRAGVALALGPAIGPPGAADRLHQEFRARCLASGWRPAFYQVSDEVAGRLPRSRRILLGSEALLDVAGFGLQGRAMANLRHQVTKARRLGVSAEVVDEAAASWDALAAARRLADGAAAGSRLGEMSFSVGRRDDPAGVDRTLALAYDADRRLVAYVSWLRLPAAETMVLDEVKRAGDAPAGAVELLIAASLDAMRGRARRASLGMAPITGVAQIAGLVRVEGFLRGLLRLSGISPGLYAFKAKFHPTWEPRYLVVERLADLAPVLAATFLLHYPDAFRRRAYRIAPPVMPWTK